MQLFIGGACAGKRDAVAARFPGATSWRLKAHKPLSDCQSALCAHSPLVINGVLDWLSADLETTDSDTLRQRWQGDIQQLCLRAETLSAAIIIIATDVGRGIVPMQPEQRRLRDVNGWFTQDMTAHAERVWYVRHGLVMAIK
ncbi:bifunctional adenosylcobinamide kinase/adenosylcobinamide-phosphate guanylyltransferase [Vreelandella profundi]|uniref:bifunctional adenosylcobinamide kinase/adenosylcobinamide-phosphate guanylyltransferase n=1 Tax=Vreelandella profundi TaxID=2852117 RepID=UPI001EF02675|nr:bifunctional adenosylcobinamide kinase/adenosylcobinamide-phosphate guanylyltransferase [Halomonas profundi]